MSYRQQFHQTAHYYRPMAQLTQVTGVTPVLGLLHNQVLPADQDRVVYMDSGSTVRTARNKDLFRSIHTSQRPIKMATNAGESMLLEDGQTPFGIAYYNSDGIANINSLGLVVDECKAANDGSYVWMDSRQDDAIHVCKPCGDIRYGRTPNGLYGLEVYSDENVCMVQTVEGNLEGLTKREGIGAVKAESLKVNFCFPPEYDLTNAVRAGLIKNSPVTAKDCQNANKVFGTNAAVFKGKYARKRPTPVVEDIHTVPDEIINPHKKLDAAIDVFTISGLDFLAWIDTAIRFRKAPYMSNQKHKTFYKVIDICLRLYNHEGFWIQRLHCDRQLASKFDDIIDTWDIKLNMGAAQEHCHMAERNVRAIKDRVRAVWHTLPFRLLPSAVIIALVDRVCWAMNMFPAKEGLSKHYPPMQLLLGIMTDAARHARYPFGCYCLASNEPLHKKTMEPRGFEALMLDCIHDNIQGGWLVYDLHTFEVVTRHYIEEIPMTSTVIKRVEDKAREEGHKELKFHKRDKVHFFPNGVSAGVAGPEQGYETLLAAIEARDDSDDDSVWENEDDDDDANDDDTSVPGLCDRENSTVGGRRRLPTAVG